MAIVVKTTGVENYLDATGQAVVKTMIMGPPGLGKSRMSAFFPKPFFVSFDNSLASIADLARPYVAPNNWQECLDVITFLKLEAAKKPEDRRFNTIVVDTIDALQTKIVIPDILRSQPGKLALSGYADYGDLKAKTRMFVHEIMKLPMNVVVTCHVTHDLTDDKRPIIDAAIEGAYREKVADDFDLIGLLEWTNVEQPDKSFKMQRRLRWEPMPACVLVKDRFGKLPSFQPVTFSSDDYDTIFMAIFGDHLDGLKESQVVAEIPSTAAEVVGPQAGGPVPVKAAQTAAKAADAKADATKPAAKATTTRRPAAKKAVPAAPTKETVTRPTETVPLPESVPTAEGNSEAVTEGSTPEAESKIEAPAAETTMEQAVETVQNVLGGEVVGESTPDEPEASKSPLTEATLTQAALQANTEAAREALERRKAAVAAQQGSPPAGVLRPASQVNQPVDSNGSGEQARKALVCGTVTPRANGSKPVSSCGKDLAGEDVNKVNIALLRFGTYLCNGCLAKAMQPAAAK